MVPVFLRKDDPLRRVRILEEVHVGDLPALDDLREYVAVLHFERLRDRGDARDAVGVSGNRVGHPLRDCLSLTH
ncbi:hypothetical protein, partial [Halorubrum ezzemoulense]|uniref:hypothetical protein n=1 Tax=Halorubrum ezzemoulense TaxID=337243 RepID=UPI0020CF0D28